MSIDFGEYSFNRLEQAVEAALKMRKFKQSVYGDDWLSNDVSELEIAFQAKNKAGRFIGLVQASSQTVVQGETAYDSAVDLAVYSLMLLEKMIRKKDEQASLR